MSLVETRKKELVQVTGVAARNRVAWRLMELGLFSGAQVQVLRRAPFGGPLHVRVGDSELSLRRDEAALVNVA